MISMNTETKEDTFILYLSLIRFNTGFLVHNQSYKVQYGRLDGF